MKADNHEVPEQHQDIGDHSRDPSVDCNNAKTRSNSEDEGDQGVHDDECFLLLGFVSPT